MKKDWKNLSDKELDEAFRQASKNQSIPFRQADWEMMQEKLDSSALLFPFHQIWIWGLLLGLLLLVGLHLAGRDQLVQKENLTAYSVEPIQSTSVYLHSSDQTKVENLTESNPAPAKEKIRFNTEAIQVNSRHFIDLPAIDAITVKHELMDLSGQAKAMREEMEEPEAAVTSSRFSLTLMASPDISAFRTNEINGVGTNVGFYLEYFLNRNLSVVSGAIYGNKIYRTSTATRYGGYYPSSSNFWDGECKVLDIPVNLRYYALNGPKARGYVSGGISSYFMLREQYALTTESGNQVYTQQIDIRNQNQHLFGIINLSIGYERQLYNKWSLQIEPYIKLPVAGVGEGDISLKSTGVWIGLKHRW